MAQKKNGQKIARLLDHLKALHENTERGWWPDFVFHFTDIQNVILILSTGKLYSRNQLDAVGLTYLDAASPSIITHSSEHVKDYVRFYFRPLTPTQFHMEGIRPDSKRWLDSEGKPAHCPMPIFLLFDARTILMRSDCEYTDGNFASPSAHKGSTADFLCALPFNEIYHNGWYDKNNSANALISHRRCAEVLIPQEIDLSALRAIACRSEAEKETLLSLLPYDITRKYSQLIRVPNYRLFNKKWTYVESVRLHEKKVWIQFSPDSITPGPFRATVDFLDPTTGKTFTRKAVSSYAANVLATIDLSPPLSYYRIRLTLDDHIAYDNTYLPF